MVVSKMTNNRNKSVTFIRLILCVTTIKITNPVKMFSCIET